MAITWGAYREQVRRSLLKDTTQTTWQDDELRDMVWWALDVFCAHTAAVTSVTIPATGTIYTVPENLYSPLEETGLLYLDANGTVTNLYTARPGISHEDPETYSVWGSEIVLETQPVAGANLVIRYFAYYNHPYSDDDTIDIPRWAFSAFNHLVTAYALTPVGVQSANISQWKDRQDSGQPENNALRVQQQHHYKLYEQELSRVPPQDRSNFYKKLLR